MFICLQNPSYSFDENSSSYANRQNHFEHESCKIKITKYKSETIHFRFLLNLEYNIRSECLLKNDVISLE